MPAVSVIVLVYKAEEYIEKCARSLFEQTLEDIEYVFVDDCSPDRSMEILSRVLDDYPQRRSQVKIVRNQTNRGQAYSRQKGVEAASGDYIIHCDSDDYVEKDIYGKLYSKALSDNLDIVLCTVRFVYPDHDEIAKDKLGAEDLLSALISMDIFHHLVDKLVSRKAYQKGIIYPKSNMCEDIPMIIQLAGNCNSFGYVHEALYNYVIRDDSISWSKNTVAKVDQIKDNVDLALTCINSRGLAAKYRKEVNHLKCWVKSAAFNLPREYYLGLYPEVNLHYLFDRRFSIMERLGHLTTLLGIHGISKSFVRKKK